MTTTVAVIGQLVGSGVFPSLADKYGRLVVIYTNAIALTVCYILAAVVPWFSAFVILRFLLGAFGQVTYCRGLDGRGHFWKELISFGGRALYKIIRKYPI